uniref:RFX-type winged-helix domain-containing protein n=1 Tax=Ditylenchus dipsaci TaxID=166011 RepID=A0A915D6S4_9BILA
MELPPFLAHTSSSSTLLTICPSSSSESQMVVGWAMPEEKVMMRSVQQQSVNCQMPSGQCTMLTVGNHHQEKYIMIRGPSVPPGGFVEQSSMSHYQPIQSPISLHQQQNNGNYVLQSGQSNSPPGSGDEDNNGSGGMGHTARTPPERCTLYDHYLSHCAEAQLEPVNAASFGKLIRSVFKGLRTRRLGTRGNSKYHYNGIRIKPSSSLLTIVSPEEYNRMNAGTHQTARNPRRISGAFQQANGASSSHNSGMQQQQNRSNTTLHSDSPNSISSNHQTSEYNDSSHQRSDGMKNDEYLNDSEAIANYENPIMGQPGIGDNSDITEQTRSAFNNNRSRISCSSVSVTKTNGSRTSRGSMGSQSNRISSSESESQSMAMGTGQVPRIAIPNLDELEEYLLPLGYTVAHVLKFTDAYVSNCAEILENIKRLRFDGIEHIWTGFWQDGDKQNLNVNVAENGANNHVTSLEQVHVFRLSTLPQIQKYVETMDLAFYQVILEVLIPHVLRPALSPRLSCQIRNFAKNIDTWTSKVLENAPINVKQSKLASVRLLANSLTRYTSFNHLADAVRAVLKNKEQINQMYTDFCKCLIQRSGAVDFGIVHSQSDWICGCDPTLVASIEREFKENLRQQKNLDEWTEWMEAVVDQMLAKYHDQPIHVQLEVSKQFLLKWSFYSSMILRDFTCRSAESFGSFHLIRLFYDEYLFLLVEMRLAKATNQPIICVMSQSWLQTYQSPRANHSMFQPSTNNNVQQPTSYANNHSNMLSLNGAGGGGIPTTVYVSTGHLIEPTYSHISSVSSANSSHPHIVIPSHSTSTGIHYVLDNNQSPNTHPCRL